MKREHFAPLAAVLLIVATSGGAIAATGFADGVDPDSGLGYLAQDAGGWGGVPDAVATTPDGTPLWHVKVDSRAALEDWTNASEERELQHYAESNDMATVAAPVDHIGTGWLDRQLGNGLAARPYVTGIAAARDYSVPEPPKFEFGDPLGFYAKHVKGLSMPTTGVAQSAEQTTIGEARAAHNATNVPDGSGVRVAVLDNTWSYNQSLYGDRIGGAYDFVDDEPAHANNSYRNVSHKGVHGDWTMSAIGADAANDSYDGVAPGATMYFGRVLGESGGTSADIVEGLEWACVEQNVDVVSLSLGSTFYSAALDEAVTNCAEQGTVVVIAAGNSAQVQPVGIGSPADTMGEDPQADGIITVAAANTSSPSTAGPAVFSQHGPDPGAASTTYGATRGAEPTVAAAGMNVTVATDQGLLTLSGTSMATPIVAGSAAVIRDTYPQSSSNVRIEQRIGQGAAPMPNAGVHEAGAGYLDVMGALNTEPDNSTSYYADQRTARTQAAQSRDAAYEWLSANADGELNAFGFSIEMPTLGVVAA